MVVAQTQAQGPTQAPSSNGHKPKPQRGGLSGHSHKALRASIAASKAARYASEVQADADTFRLMAANAEFNTALVQRRTAFAQRDAAFAQRDYYRAATATLKAQAQTPATPAPAPAAAPAPAVQPVNRPWWETAAAFALIALAIVAMAILINSWVTRPVTVPPAPPAQALTSIEEVAAMFGNAIELDELAMQGDVVKYTFKPASHSIQFPPDFQLYAVVRPGWEIRDLDMNLLFRAGERHYFPLKSGAFEAYQVAGR